MNCDGLYDFLHFLMLSGLGYFMLADAFIYLRYHQEYGWVKTIFFMIPYLLVAVVFAHMFADVTVGAFCAPSPA